MVDLLVYVPLARVNTLLFNGLGGRDSAITLSGKSALGTAAPQTVKSGTLDMRASSLGVVG